MKAILGLSDSIEARINATVYRWWIRHRQNRQSFTPPPYEATMATAAPSRLLTLPREIRNIIYDFLSREIDLRTINELGGVATVVHITNAPCVEVLLTHSRLHDEYLEVECFRNLSAAITRVEQWKNDIKWLSTAQLKVKDDAALARVKTVTFRCIYGRKIARGPIEMIDALFARGATLHTVRLIEESRVEEGYMKKTRGKEPTYTNLLPASKVHQNTPMMGQIHGLPLRQAGFGMRRHFTEYQNERSTYELIVIDAGVFSVSVSAANFRAAEVYWPVDMKPRPWAWDQMEAREMASTASTAPTDATAPAGSTAPTGANAPLVTKRWAKGSFGWNDNTKSIKWKSKAKSDS